MILYLELLGVGPVKKNTLYDKIPISLKIGSQEKNMDPQFIWDAGSVSFKTPPDF